MTDLMTLAQGADLAPLGTIDDTEYVSLSVVLARHDGAVWVVCLASDWPATLQARLIQAGEVIAFQQQQIEALAARAAAGEDASAALAKLGPVAAAMSAELRAIKTQGAQPRRAGVADEPGKYLAPPWRCAKCGETKDADAYYTKRRGERLFRQRTICKACMTQKESTRPLEAREEGELECPECAAAGVLPAKALFTKQKLQQHRWFAHRVRGVHAKPGARPPATIRPADDAAPGWQCKQCGTDGLPDRHYDEFCVDCASTPTELAA